ncbi:MAG: protein kinase domain-containing protein [Ginsengibacter sp.]
MKVEFTKYLKQNKNKINLSIGEVNLIKPIGEGGNGLVFEGEVEGYNFAFKFLLTDTTGNSYITKTKRFVSEYFNVALLENKTGLVKYIDYDTITITNAGKNYLIPVIVMKKYKHCIKVLEEPDIVEKFEDVLNFLLDTVENIHSQGIIHRDIKPENILMENGEYALADFGIASFNPEIFKLRAITKKGEKLGNRLFSALEQETGNVEAKKTMDIYAVGQVLHWVIFSENHRGTNRKKISSKYEKLAKYDTIIDKCLSNSPSDRYQSISEIRDHLKLINFPDIDPWKYLYKFGEELVKSFPKNEFGFIHSNNKSRIDKLFISLKQEEPFFQNNLWWHDGSRNTHFKLLQKAPGVWKLNNKEITVIEIWIYYDLSFFNDFIILHFEKGVPFKFQDKEQFYTAFVDDEYQITYSEFENGYAEIGDEVIDLKNHKFEFIEREKEEGYFIISTRFHCALSSKNDKHVIQFFKRLKENNGKLDIEEFAEFERTIRANKFERVQQDL